MAKQIDADGIQLSFKSFIEVNNKLCTENIMNLKKSVDSFRIMRGKNKIYKMIGVSIHSYEEGIQACKLGADYVIYGHVFQTDCKKGIEPEGFKEIENLFFRDYKVLHKNTCKFQGFIINFLKKEI